MDRKIKTETRKHLEKRRKSLQPVLHKDFLGKKKYC